jgi:hypothetical protein
MEVIHDFRFRTDELIQKGYNLKIESYIIRGLEILRKRTYYFILFTLLLFVFSSIPVLGFVVFQPMAAGILLVSYYLSSGREVVFENFFDGFKHFAALFLFTIIGGILIFLGLLALIVPGIYLSVGYIFAPFYIVFGRMDFWQAMESSRRLVHREWFSFFAFMMVLLIINILGLLAFGIGLLITVPLSYCAVYAAFDDIIGVSN